MKLAIMQPYFFPYIGYFHLIYAVDNFVVYDDVNFINKGWINRNFILFNNDKKLLSLSLVKATQNKLINEISIFEPEKSAEKILNLISISYKKAPFYKDVFPLLEEIMFYKEDNLSIFLQNNIKKICEYLDIHTKILVSSQIEKNNDLKGQEKILEICKKLNTDNYINPIGGVELYDKQNFQNNNIILNFIKTEGIAYPQFKNEFIANLSIIDVLMFNSKEKVHEMLKNYILL